MRIGLIKKIKAFRQWLKENPEFEHEFPKINTLKAFSAESTGIYENTCMCTEWPNGEGYDFSWYGKGGDGDEKKISLHDSEIETMLECLNKMGNFNTE
jgi:hypothetical protein